MSEPFAVGNYDCKVITSGETITVELSNRPRTVHFGGTFGAAALFAITGFNKGIEYIAGILRAHPMTFDESCNSLICGTWRFPLELVIGLRLFPLSIISICHIPEIYLYFSPYLPRREL